MGNLCEVDSVRANDQSFTDVAIGYGYNSLVAVKSHLEIGKHINDAMRNRDFDGMVLAFAYYQNRAAFDLAAKDYEAGLI